MKKVFLTLAVVFATSTVLVSCGGDKATGNEVPTVNEKTVDETSEQPEVADTTKKVDADTTKKEGETKPEAKGTEAKTKDEKKPQ